MVCEFFQADDGAIGGTVTLVNKMDIHRKNLVFTRFFAPFWHFGTVTKNHETQIFLGFWWGANSCHRIFDPTGKEKLNHKQANEKFFCGQTTRRMKGSHSPFLFLKIKKERGNLKKMDETEVYRYKKTSPKKRGKEQQSVSAEALKMGRASAAKG